MPALTEAATRRRDARHHDSLPGRPGPRRRRLRPARRRGARPHGRERRRQVDAHQGAHRRLLRSTAARSRSPASDRVFSSTGGRAGRPGSRPSTRRSTSARTSRSARTSCSATSREARAGSTGRRSTREAARHLENLGLHLDTQLAAVEPLDRGPAARRHQPGDGARRAGADPRRADLEPRPRRGRAALRRHPRPARQGCRHPVREPLPRPGLRDRRPHHGAAQRTARRRVPRSQDLPRGAAGDQDDRPRDRRAGRHLGDGRAQHRPHRRSRCSARRASLAAASSAEADLDVYRGRGRRHRRPAGLGRTELVRLLYGADRADDGQIEINGTPVKVSSPRHAIDHRIAFSSEDRRAEGIVADLTVAENIVLGMQARRGWLRRIRARRAGRRGRPST